MNTDFDILMLSNYISFYFLKFVLTSCSFHSSVGALHLAIHFV